MNRSQVSGFTKNIAGIWQERAGKIFGNQKQQISGRKKQRLGIAEKNLGDARDIIKNALKRIRTTKQAFLVQSLLQRTPRNTKQELLL